MEDDVININREVPNKSWKPTNFVQKISVTWPETYFIRM